jgi:predicted RNA-binding Zn-ribbon protein involved in translation (DUF1610 family)
MKEKKYQADFICPNCKNGYLIKKYDSNNSLEYECDNCNYKEA